MRVTAHAQDAVDIVRDHRDDFADRCGVRRLAVFASALLFDCTSVVTSPECLFKESDSEFAPEAHTDSPRVVKVTLLGQRFHQGGEEGEESVKVGFLDRRPRRKSLCCLAAHRVEGVCLRFREIREGEVFEDLLDEERSQVFGRDREQFENSVDGDVAGRGAEQLPRERLAPVIIAASVRHHDTDTAELLTAHLSDLNRWERTSARLLRLKAHTSSGRSGRVRAVYIKSPIQEYDKAPQTVLASSGDRGLAERVSGPLASSKGRLSGMLKMDAITTPVASRSGTRPRLVIDACGPFENRRSCCTTASSASSKMTTYSDSRVRGAIEVRRLSWHPRAKPYDRRCDSFSAKSIQSLTRKRLRLRSSPMQIREMRERVDQDLRLDRRARQCAPG